MKVLIFLQNLPLHTLLATTVALTCVLSGAIIGLVRLSVRRSGADPAKPLHIHDLVTVTSILFALMLSFSAAGIWNDWLQASSAVQREALALENVLTLADGLSPDRAAKIKESVIAYAKAASEHEWPAMARLADADDPLYAVSDRILVSLIAELSRNVASAGSSPVPAMLLPQVFEARSARLARLTMASSGLSSVQWFSLIALFASTLVVVALVHNNDAALQVVAMSLCSLAGAVAFFVVLAHDRPFVGVVSVSPGPLLQLAARADAETGRVVASPPQPR